MMDGSGTPWHLLDGSRAIKPLVWQERIPYRFTALDQENDKNVFWQDECIYGVRARVNAGFGLWQLAHGSKATLDYDGFAAARTAMMTLKGDAGRVLGIEPTRLVVPPSLERKALAIVNAENDAAGASNVYRGTVKLIVAPWLEG
jgi:phage major head subunit gpT-like protein